jgi:hypothetical protein
MTDYEKTITLPSKGLFYNGALPGGELQIRGMTTQEEKLLASPNSGSGTKLLDLIFKKCASFPEAFPPSKLIAYDRVSLLMHIRVLSYGPTYQISFVCADCNRRNFVDVNLSELLAEEITVEEDAEATQDVSLPSSGKTITWRLPTGEDELAADKQRGRLKGGAPSDLVEFRLARQITHIDGAVPQPMDLLNFIRTLSTRDNLAIRDSMAQYSFGTVSEMEYVCQQCGSPTPPMGLPITDDFFRMVSPSVRHR